MPATLAGRACSDRLPPAIACAGRRDRPG